MVVYMTTNLINGKKYIGRDASNDNSYLGSGKLILMAIKKYGRVNFKKEILEVCSSFDELTTREEYWLNYYDAGNNPMFYNIHNSSVGCGIGKLNHMFGKKFSDEEREKLRKKAKRGKDHHQFGKPLREDVKNKISQTKKKNMKKTQI